MKEVTGIQEPLLSPKNHLHSTDHIGVSTKAPSNFWSKFPQVIDEAKKLYLHDESIRRETETSPVMSCFELSLSDGNRENKKSLPRTKILGCEEIRPEDMHCMNEQLMDNGCEIWAQRYKCGNCCSCCCLGIVVGHLVMTAQQAYKSRFAADPSEAELVEKYFLCPDVQHAVATTLLGELGCNLELNTSTEQSSDKAPIKMMME